MKEIELLSPRLRFAAEHVREGAVFADIGTDHAKLPIALVTAGRVSTAIASDIGEQPAAIAEMRVAEKGLAGKIRVTVCDGLAGVGRFSPTDIAICGMGGKTIVGILRAADFIRDARVRLILQPMTDFSILREYLAAEGFAVIDEDIVLSEGRMYQCLCVSYAGAAYPLTALEAELGQLNIRRRTPLFLRYVRRRKTIVEKQFAGKKQAGADADAELLLLDGYNRILEGEHETA